MNRFDAALRVGLLTALAATSFAPSAAAKPKPAASALSTKESLRQTLAFRARGPAAGVTIRETRRLRATLSVLLPNIDPSAVTGNTYVGLRIGDWTFERPVSFDRFWKPGKTRATFRVPSSDEKRAGFTTVKTNWTGGVLSVVVVSTSEAPMCAADVAAPAGAVTSPIDGAARFGAEHVHLGGAATGTMKRTVLPVLDASADLARLDLVGHADVVPDTNDTSAPSIVITLPQDGSTRAPGAVRVTGTMRDDRTIASVSHVLDFGTEVQDPFAIEPSSGFLGDVGGTFSFDVAGTPGLHSLVVYARDVAGNSSFARTSFLVPVAGAITLRASVFDTMAVDDKGRMQEWGSSVATPKVMNFPSVRAVARRLVVLGDGTVVTNNGDPAGAPSTGASGPVQVQGLDNIADVASGTGAVQGGGDFGLALRADGSVWSWGSNAVGQLGDGTTTPHYPPTKIAGLPPIRAITAGDSMSLAIDDQGDVWAWGNDGLTAGANDTTPKKVVGPANVVSIAAGQFFEPVGYAVAADGTVWNWGYAFTGQLATASGTFTGQFKAPGKIDGLAPVKQAALGYNHVLLRMADGTVLAAGANFTNQYGQLGDGTTNAHTDLRPVAGLADVVSVAAGQYQSFALLSDGTIRAFGSNSRGALGDGTLIDRLSPVIVTLSQ